MLPPYLIVSDNKLLIQGGLLSVSDNEIVTGIIGEKNHPCCCSSSSCCCICAYFEPHDAGDETVVFTSVGSWESSDPPLGTCISYVISHVGFTTEGWICGYKFDWDMGSCSDTHISGFWKRTDSVYPLENPFPPRTISSQGEIISDMRSWDLICTESGWAGTMTVGGGNAQKIEPEVLAEVSGNNTANFSVNLLEDSGGYWRVGIVDVISSGSGYTDGNSIIFSSPDNTIINAQGCVLTQFIPPDVEDMQVTIISETGSGAILTINQNDFVPDIRDSPTSHRRVATCPGISCGSTTIDYSWWSLKEGFDILNVVNGGEGYSFGDTIVISSTDGSMIEEAYAYVDYLDEDTGEILGTYLNWGGRFGKDSGNIVKVLVCNGGIYYKLSGEIGTGCTYSVAVSQDLYRTDPGNPNVIEFCLVTVPSSYIEYPFMRTTTLLSSGNEPFCYGENIVFLKSCGICCDPYNATGDPPVLDCYDTINYHQCNDIQGVWISGEHLSCSDTSCTGIFPPDPD